MIDFVLDLIFPNVCGICNKICKNSFCKKCELKLKEVQKTKIIDYTKNKEVPFDYHLYLYKYEGLIRQKLIEYKFNDKAYLYETFAKIILNNEKICGILKTYDIIIPIPMHIKKENKRGYNQAKLIAKGIAKNACNIELCDSCLIKIKDTKPQSALNKKERQDNLKNAYKVINKEKIKDKNIIIFDDIYTTGSTAINSSKVLKEAGARSIAILTIAKD